MMGRIAELEVENRNLKQLLAKISEAVSEENIKRVQCNEHEFAYAVVLGQVAFYSSLDEHGHYRRLY